MPPPQGQPGHPRLGHDPGRDDQAMTGHGGVHVAEAAAAAAYADQLVRGVYGHLAQAAQVQGQAAVGHGLACHVVAAAPDRRVQPVVPGHVDRGHDVGGARAAQDQPGAPVNHGVPHLAGGGVLGMVRADDVALEPAGQLVGDARPQPVIEAGGCGGAEASGRSQ